jgi:hypothetical protein
MTTNKKSKAVWILKIRQSLGWIAEQKMPKVMFLLLNSLGKEAVNLLSSHVLLIYCLMGRVTSHNKLPV